MLNTADLESIHRFSSRHRDRVIASVQCGCFYCLATFAPAEISDWIDGPHEHDTSIDGVTALCPRCGIDSVLPDSIPRVPLSTSMLEAMHEYWFERTTTLE